MRSGGRPGDLLSRPSGEVGERGRDGRAVLGVPSWTVVGPASIAGLPLPKRKTQEGASEHRHGHTRNSRTTTAAL